MAAAQQVTSTGVYQANGQVGQARAGIPMMSALAARGQQYVMMPLVRCAFHLTRRGMRKTDHDNALKISMKELPGSGKPPKGHMKGHRHGLKHTATSERTHRKSHFGCAASQPRTQKYAFPGNHNYGSLRAEDERQVTMYTLHLTLSMNSHHAGRLRQPMVEMVNEKHVPTHQMEMLSSMDMERSGMGIHTRPSH